MSYPRQLCTATDTYNGPFADDYESNVRRGYFPPPGFLHTKMRPLLSSFASATSPKLLDVGIGSGLSAAPFTTERPDIAIHGMDSSIKMLKLCRQRLPQAVLSLVNLDTSAFPYEDETFDICISSGTLYLLSNAMDTIQHMMRVTRKGGLLALNFEPSPDDNSHVRQNSTRNSAGDLALVETYQYPENDIRKAIETSGGIITFSETRNAMEKLVGPPLRFTDMLVLKQ